jgi:phosphoribosylaminoimidazolecarboxamide formyltransferase / IMP cyclohydrolase
MNTPIPQNTGDPGFVPVRRALLSVSDKRGIVELGQALLRHGCEILASGGTLAALSAAGLPVTPVERVSGSPEAFQGRMKTLSFGISSALLFDRDRDADEARALGVDPIDLVACNLYPFAEAWRNHAGEQALVEQIDVGGPTMIRAAAKNHRHVAVLCDPEQYRAVIAELHEHGGALSFETRRRLMRAAFNATADYDATIAQAMDALSGEPSLRLAYEGARSLRYGENSHQDAHLFRERGSRFSFADLEQLHGAELSYNNLVDVLAAVEAVADESAFAVAVVKHTNPCGLAVAPVQRQALEAAWAGDPISAFGSVIAFNRPIEADAAAFFELGNPDKSRRRFIEVVVAPAVSPEALELLRLHDKLRVLVLDPALLQTDGASGPLGDRRLRALPGACLVQDADRRLAERFEVMTSAAPQDRDDALWDFGLRAVRQLRSNAIAVVRRTSQGTLQLLGMGAGQPNRVVSVRLALEKCRENLTTELGAEAAAARIEAEMGRTVLVSDAYFPFADNVELAAAAGVRTVLEPGGSIRDRLVIRRADELGVAMIFTGLRHFKH